MAVGAWSFSCSWAAASALRMLLCAHAWCWRGTTSCLYSLELTACTHHLAGRPRRYPQPEQEQALDEALPEGSRQYMI